jgi:hypothetical protein
MEPDADQEMGFLTPVGHETNVRSSAEDADRRHRIPPGASIEKDAERMSTNRGAEKKPIREREQSNQTAGTSQSESENDFNQLGGGLKFRGAA